jgi:hypothetical protein
VKAAAAPARKARVAGAATGSGRLSINDQLVLTFLNKSLQRKQWRRLSHSAMAQGAGIPLGSVGLALRRLMAGGHVLEGEKGHYKRG